MSVEVLDAPPELIKVKPLVSIIVEDAEDNDYDTKQLKRGCRVKLATLLLPVLFAVLVNVMKTAIFLCLHLFFINIGLPYKKLHLGFVFFYMFFMVPPLNINVLLYSINSTCSE